jgi:Ras-related protein Rab-2A|mmetsp:Transcript_12034/g.14256  ORF Transcript_12034/g.14256 Transcript_12034/m.14256 type:complete len:165 (+) Transcript_12034:89-583(+)|eukprot:CAMPEP_0185567102 /NCGR_PEP_ID=MMETSP0434-20130131/481_1 /TAXON_ID=626734 ORGANISM="Favella taraikaensis, Strain Fe Narragansett Bay" /NCGR_SAMPLE_ID=MMETSP0434 /ASSEMBLY_ACC=CAM_ASM_000379 /LENGTH=164 /DNA_ID=CAMNT_0028181249 /DNA_START=90 /DNA_END=584 /DNA_ORIENTATION=+
MHHFDVLFKIVILGDTGVGKTCILKRLTDQSFTEEHGVTIGVEFGNFGMIIKEETYVKLQIWDTAGQESFRSITRSFYQGSHGVFLVFDITCKQSFEDIRTQWLREVHDHTSESTIIYLVGNFADMDNEREVSHNEALAFAREQGFGNYVETSAKTGQNVQELF